VVVAIGNPLPRQYGHCGIVSAKYRQIGQSSYDNYIQTTHPSTGNSGGPLLNTAGEVVGVNTAFFLKAAETLVSVSPSPSTCQGSASPVEKGKVVRGWLGVIFRRSHRNSSRSSISRRKGPWWRM